jgi:hypothetical protein
MTEFEQAIRVAMIAIEGKSVELRLAAPEGEPMTTQQIQLYETANSLRATLRRVKG